MLHHDEKKPSKTRFSFIEKNRKNGNKIQNLTNEKSHFRGGFRSFFGLILQNTKKSSENFHDFQTAGAEKFRPYA